jgi:hypothetical protein
LSAAKNLLDEDGGGGGGSGGGGGTSSSGLALASGFGVSLWITTGTSRVIRSPSVKAGADGGAGKAKAIGV